MGGRKRKGVPVGGRGVPLQFSLSLTPLHTRAQEDFLLRCTANNSRITVGKHNWDLKQEGWTDGESHYACTSHTLTQWMHFHTDALSQSQAKSSHTQWPPPDSITRCLVIDSIYLSRECVCMCFCVFTTCMQCSACGLQRHLLKD